MLHAICIRAKGSYSSSLGTTSPVSLVAIAQVLLRVLLLHPHLLEISMQLHLMPMCQQNAKRLSRHFWRMPGLSLSLSHTHSYLPQSLPADPVESTTMSFLLPNVFHVGAHFSFPDNNAFACSANVSLCSLGGASTLRPNSPMERWRFDFSLYASAASLVSWSHLIEC